MTSLSLLACRTVVQPMFKCQHAMFNQNLPICTISISYLSTQTKGMYVVLHVFLLNLIRNMTTDLPRGQGRVKGQNIFPHAAYAHLPPIWYAKKRHHPGGGGGWGGARVRVKSYQLPTYHCMSHGPLLNRHATRPHFKKNGFFFFLHQLKSLGPPRG